LHFLTLFLNNSEKAMAKRKAIATMANVQQRPQRNVFPDVTPSRLLSFLACILAIGLVTDYEGATTAVAQAPRAQAVYDATDTFLASAPQRR
jgi:hypothetical protein